MGALVSFSVIFLVKALGASGLKQKTRPCLGECEGMARPCSSGAPSVPCVSPTRIHTYTAGLTEP